MNSFAHYLQQVKKWSVSGLNPSFRACKYLPGHYFGTHIDHSNYVSKSKSWFTIMLYLNSSNDGDYEGGNTNFFDPKCFGTNEKIIRESIKPDAGMGIVFVQDDITLPHEGALVSSGVKYMIRTDVLYNKIKKQKSDSADTTKES
jgi:prolyl 4-hydroxylase